MRIDIRNKIKDSFLYKRFAYDSEGFIALMKFLEDEDIVDEFCKECNFKRSCLADDLEFGKKEISLKTFFYLVIVIRFRFQKVKKDMIFGTIKFLKMKTFIKLEINCYNDKMCNSFS